MQTTAAATSTRTSQAGDRRRRLESSHLVRADRTLFLAPFSFICKPIIFVNTGSGQTRGNHSETTVWLAGKGPLTDGLYHYESEVQATIDFGFDGAKAKQSKAPRSTLFTRHVTWKRDGFVCRADRDQAGWLWGVLESDCICEFDEQDREADPDRELPLGSRRARRLGAAGAARTYHVAHYRT